MSSTTIYMSAGTWYKDQSSGTHSTDSWLRSTRKYGSTIGYGAVIQFEIPNSLKYKRVTSATLRYYTKFILGGSESTSATDTGMDIAPYITTPSAISQITGVNLESYGELGEFVNVEAYSSYGGSYPSWRVADITSIFSSNLYQDTYFTVILRGWPGYNSDVYAAIGGINSGYAATLTLEYEDVIQQPPSPSYPVGTYVNENTDILFAWAWNSSTSAVQASVQLEYKLSTASEYTVVSLTQTTHTYLLSGGLAQGTYQWRIKGTNDAGETSDYSGVAEFNVVGKPAVPVINEVPNRALTAITWNTTDQNSYDITLTDVNGKTLIDDTVASSVSSYKPNLFLKGTYTVGIRTRNSTGLVSDWAYKTFSITAAGPTAPVMQLYQNDSQVNIVVEITSGNQYAVMRTDEITGKEEILGIMEAGTFKDATFGFDIPYKYVVRAWSTGGYTDSVPARICYPKIAVVLETDDDELIIEKSEETFLPYAEDYNGDMAVYNCIGRDLPIVEHGTYESRAFKTRLYIREGQKERLVAMAKKDRIFYRDYSGRAFPVAIQPPISFDRWMNDGYMANIVFIRIADTEVVVNV